MNTNKFMKGTHTVNVGKVWQRVKYPTEMKRHAPIVVVCKCGDEYFFYIPDPKAALNYPNNVMRGFETYTNAAVAADLAGWQAVQAVGQGSMKRNFQLMMDKWTKENEPRNISE